MTHDPADRRGEDGNADEAIETQIERTELAWMRTALACAALGAAAVRLTGRASVALAVGLAVVVGSMGLAASWWRIRGLRATAEPLPPHAAGVAMLAGAVALVDVIVLVALVR